MFNSLSKEDIFQIIDIELKGLYERVASLNYKLKISRAAKEFIAEKGYDSQYGARPRITSYNVCYTKLLRAKELSTQNALELCQKFLDLYCEAAPAKQRTSRFVEKMGIQTIKEKLGL